MPLFAQVGRADDGKALDLAPVEQFPRDQACLDGLADTDVVGDEQPDGVELQRHEQGNQLIGARFDIEIAEAAERSRTGTQLEAKRVAQQQRCLLGAWRVGIGKIERRGHRHLGFERKVDERRIVFRAAERTKLEEIVARLGEDHPLAVPRPDQISRFEGDRRVHFRSSVSYFAADDAPGPKTQAYSSTTRSHDVRSSSKRTTVSPASWRRRVASASRVCWRSPRW